MKSPRVCCCVARTFAANGLTSLPLWYAGYPVPGKTLVYDESQTIDLENEPLNGGILVKVVVLSIDPYLRRKMLDPSIPSFLVSFFV